ncbi:MAG: SAM-dependent methyltransferase, partial [Myxococcota bacterium]
MTEPSESRARELYDEVPYPSRPQAETHPDRLATIGRLFGLPVAPPSQCRVIEIGCCDGGNLIPMAFRLPGSTFVGLDISPRSIKRGEQTARALGLKNLELVAADVQQADSGSAQADYIICHGMWSWVEPPVRDAVLRLIRRALAPGGVALLSYNVSPGWHMLRPMRDLMRFHARTLEGTPTEVVAKALELVRLVADGTEETSPVYSAGLHRALNVVGHFSPEYLFHDFLAPINEPFQFSDFAKVIHDGGLQYLGESGFGTMMHYGLEEALTSAVRSAATGLVEMQQYLDFARNTTFRYSLLCRADQPLRRELDEQSLNGLHV